MGQADALVKIVNKPPRILINGFKAKFVTPAYIQAYLPGVPEETKNIRKWRLKSVFD